MHLSKQRRLRKMKVCLILILLAFVSVTCGFVTGKCPPASQIVPCICKEKPVVVTCSNVHNSVDIDTVFKKSSVWYITSLVIDKCSMPYIPKSVMEEPTLEYLNITNSNFITLFDGKPTKGADLKKLRISNVKVMGGYDWSFLSSNTKMAEFGVYDSTLKIIGESFRKNLPSGIVDMRLENTKTLKIIHQAFSNFNRIRTFYCRRSFLKSLSRDMFPKPWNSIVWIDLSINKLGSLPEDMFNDMPILQIVRLQKNLLTTIPEKPFSIKPTKATRAYYLEGNPIFCDCAIKWLTTNNAIGVTGQCAEPKEFKGKRIGLLEPKDFSFCK